MKVCGSLKVDSSVSCAGALVKDGGAIAGRCEVS